jgi:hypothetical protein
MRSKRQRLGVLALGTAGFERAAPLPDGGHAAFDIGGLVVFLDHDNANGVLRKEQRFRASLGAGSCQENASKQQTSARF